MNQLELEIKNFLGSLDPLIILDKWLKQALQQSILKEPWAMVLSTTSLKKKASSRVVLLKEIYKGNLYFYTNYQSSKAKDIKQNPQVAVNFYWPLLNKQIRIEGQVKKTSRNKSIAYWKTRKKSHQLSQWLSLQSKEVPANMTLQHLTQKAKQKFKDKPVPCPKFWGGYIISIEKIEFWINNPYRLHDRFLFEKTQKGWKKKRLFP